MHRSSLRYHCSGCGLISERLCVVVVAEAELGLPDIVVTNAVQQYQWTTVLEQDEADCKYKVYKLAIGEDKALHTILL